MLAMNTKFYTPMLLVLALISISDKSSAAPKVTLTTNHIAAANINQGNSGNIIYAVKMKVTVSAVTINNMQFTLSGTHDNNDLTAVYLYYNPSAPVISGASYLGGTTTTFAGPHTYSINISRSMNVNDSGYYIISANISATANDNHTIQINGAANPVVFGYSVTSTIVNNQTNNAGVQTIQAANITLTTDLVDSANINQGATGNILYVTKMKVAVEPVTVTNMQFTFSGSQDDNDLTAIYLYYNPSAPVISGASYLGGTTTTYASGHAYSINISRGMSVGESGYYIISFNVSNTATDNHTIILNGAINPVKFGFSTAPNVTNSQTNKAKKKTIQSADITLTTDAVAAADIQQSSTGNIIYVAKMNVKTEPVTVSNMQFTFSGTQDDDDLTAIYLYYNPNAPVISGASYLGGTTTTYASGHTYSINISRGMSIGETGYYLITTNIRNTATDNHTIILNGATNPVQFAFTTAPNVTNNQTNKAGKKTIQAPDVTITTDPVAAADIQQSSTGNIIYVAKMNVKTEPVTVSNMQFTFSGTQDDDDLTAIYLYYNPNAPVISGASYLGGTTTTYASGHTYSINISRAMSVNETGYYLITTNVRNTATDNHTIILNGATDPLQFAFTTAPNVTDNQTNKAKKKTIQAADVTVTSSAVAAGKILLGSTGNIVYALKASVKTEPVTATNMQFKLDGTHDANDLTAIYLYYNASAPVISGASYLGGTTTLYDGGHTYSINISRGMSVNESGYYIISVNVSSTANTGHTVKINGATDPVVLAYSTAPNVVNNQTNNAGAKTISASLLANKNDVEESTRAAYSVSNVFPNPAKTSFSFTVASDKNETIKAQLTGRNGNVMFEKNFNITQAQSQYSMNVSTVQTGTYYLILLNNKGELINRQQVNIQR